MADVNFKKYVSYFKFYFLAIAILGALLAILLVWRKGEEAPPRTNEECLTQERVFDYGEVLSSDEEERLGKLIGEKETETGCDIVLVTLNESLEEYARQYEDSQGYLQPWQYVMVYADNFYDEHGFGYNKPHGDGVILVDNWYREADGSVYSWLSTCGKAMDQLSGSEIDALLNRALADVESEPYSAYARYVELFAQEMKGKGRISIPFWAPLLAAAVGTGIFIAVNLNLNKGRKTVNLNTYVEGGRPDLRRRDDIFLHKTVTQRRIPQNNGGSGGGGGHRSSGGVSHGGGGHSR